MIIQRMIINNVEHIIVNDKLYKLIGKVKKEDNDGNIINKEPIKDFIREYNINKDTIEDYETKDYPILYEKYCEDNNLQYPGPNRFKKQFENILNLKTVRARSGETRRYIYRCK